MASSKRKKHGAGYVILIAVLILVLLAVVAAVTGYSLVARRVKALQAGAAFTFDYEITSTADSSADKKCLLSRLYCKAVSKRS